MADNSLINIPQKVHFIGIDGISMSGLATILQYQGHHISGSDLKQSHPTRRLIENGARFFWGQSAENIAEATPEMVVYTAAISKDNPELQAAFSSGVPVIDRATFLGKMTREFEQTIAVGGTHGKTTTTAMLALALLRSNADPTALVGGELDAIEGNVRVGHSDILLTEACEYVETFLKLTPYIGIILNIDKDHLDYFSSMDHIITAFEKFAKRIKPNGKLVIYADDLKCQRVIQAAKVEVISYGFSDKADWQARDIDLTDGKAAFKAYYQGEYVAAVTLLIPGKHNIANALACLATCYSMNLSLEAVVAALQDYRGTHRRFELKGKINGATLIDDYAHHPEEIKATLAAAHSYNPQRIIVAFQPHTYSRTKELMQDFATCFAGADKVFVTDIYAAREKNTYGVDSQMLVDEISKQHDDVVYVSSLAETAQKLRQEVRPGDLVFTMGAGTIYEVAEKLLSVVGGE